MNYKLYNCQHTCKLDDLAGTGMHRFNYHRLIVNIIWVLKIKQANKTRDSKDTKIKTIVYCVIKKCTDIDTTHVFKQRFEISKMWNSNEWVSNTVSPISHSLNNPI